MVVMKPDTFDVENKEVSSQVGLIKNAIGWVICCCCRQTIQATSFVLMTLKWELSCKGSENKYLIVQLYILLVQDVLRPLWVRRVWFWQNIRLFTYSSFPAMFGGSVPPLKCESAVASSCRSPSGVHFVDHPQRGGSFSAALWHSPNPV